MAFLGGAECSTAGNPLTQFTKHVQNDNTLQRDRLVGRGPGGLGESMRRSAAPNGSDRVSGFGICAVQVANIVQMMNEFLQQPGGAPPPFAMEQLRRDLPAFQTPAQRTPSPGWAAEYDPGEQARMEAAFHSSQMGAMKTNGFNPAEFSRFQQQSHTNSQRTTSPITHTPPRTNGYQRPMGYMGGMGMNMGMDMPSYSGMGMQQPMESVSNGKGKARMVELDDSNWEAQFAEMDTSHRDQDTLSDEANVAMEAELNDIDRSVKSETDYLGDFDGVWRGIQAEQASRQLAEDGTFDNAFSSEDFAAWDNFDSSLGLGTHSNTFERDPALGDYMFESSNPFLENPNKSLSAFDQGVQILRENGNLSLAALAFEAAVQQDPSHVEAWTLLGSAQAQNEKESPAIRALERALALDPTNLSALMGLAVSYTNEGYDSAAYRTLERWLSVKYPSIHPPDQVSDATDIGFSDRAILHERVTNLFIRAAQLSPSGEQMDPDVQVGLGVLFYGDEDFEKAVDCFNAALASTETGTVNRKGEVHLLWNRLGATLANSGRSEDAIAAYERALNENPNFVRARYNLGVSCINIGCYPEAAQHLLGALSMHRVVEEQGLDKAREIASGDSGPDKIDDAELERMIQHNESSNLYDTLRRAFTSMGRRDLSEKVGAGMNVEAFKKVFDF
jgi:peroxin-5